MAVRDKSAQTMRIDIEPDSMSDTDRMEAVRSWTLYGSTDTTSFPRGARSDDRSSDYAKLLQSVYDAVLITDPGGRITDFNDRALDFFRSGSKHLMGTAVIKLIAGADETLLDEVRANLESHRYTLIEARCLRYDKSLFPAEIAVNRVDLDLEGDMCFFIRDISVRKQAQEALEEAVAGLEAHDKARSEFISNVSHELRTPLTSMIYAISNMLRGVVGPLTDHVRAYLNMLDGDCRRLHGTVNDILDIRKVEDSSIELDRTTLPIGRLVGESADSLKVQARRRGVEIETDLGERYWFVDGDAGRIERVILNVVGNAVKFTPEGGSVHVAVGDDPDRENHVMINVRDTGIGIPPDAISKVTLRYFTVGEQPSGSGLGLAISKELVALHGGHLEIESPPAGHSSGTRVTISLPVVDPPQVLIIDDDAAVCEFLRQQVEGQGHRVQTLSTGNGALEEALRIRPEILVFDLDVPGMDGIELILKARDDAELERVGIIVLTGAGLGPAKAEILRTLGIPVLTKPLDTNEFLERLSGVFMGDETPVGISVRSTASAT